MNETVIITGSNGFIGSHVVRYLKEKGYFVIGVGRQKVSKTKVDQYIPCDVSSSEATCLLDSVEMKNVSALIHLAADMRKEPHTAQVVRANCTGTEQLLELCEHHQIPVFIQLSSLPVIGKPVSCPIREDHPIHPPTVYHVTKHTQELLANYATYTFGLRTVSYRISAPIGEGVNPCTIFPVFVQHALRGEDITLIGKGTRKQTYIHARYIAQAVELAIHSDACGVYNLSSYNLLSNYELAQKCIETLHSSSKIMFTGTEDPMDDYNWEVSIDKLKQDTGFEPEINIEEAILDYAHVLETH